LEIAFILPILREPKLTRHLAAHFSGLKSETIMRHRIMLLLMVVMATVSTGCTISHVVQEDYQQYLLNNSGNIEKKTLSKKARYSLSDRTVNHRTEFRSGTAGAANLWIVDFGKMLDDSLKSGDYADAFSTASDSRLHVDFDLESFEFRNFQAYLTLKIVVEDGGVAVIDKAYQVVGRNQAAKVVLTRGFAMKNAIQQSTKFAIDDIMRQLFSDLKAHNIVMMWTASKYG
jgi:hypothetical protein